MNRSLLIAATLLLMFTSASAQPPLGSGLETANYKYIAVVVVVDPEQASGVTLSKVRVRNLVELRLRAAGLTPGDDINKNGAYLIALINILGSAFHIDLRYQRIVFIKTGGRTLTLNPAITWSKGTTGSHGGNAGFIVDSLDPLLDAFLDGYLKANQK